MEESQFIKNSKKIGDNDYSITYVDWDYYIKCKYCGKEISYFHGFDNDSGCICYIEKEEWLNKFKKKYNILDTITENQLISLFESKWGNSGIKGRIAALTEEFEEFKEVYSEFEGVPEEQGNLYLHLQDEAADIFSVVLHLLHNLDMDSQTAINMTWDKIKTREKDPNYKKQW